MVFSGVFPIDSADYENLRDALVKLRLNDSAFTYEPESSTALGFGFRCGYLGLLHMEIVQERLEREYNLNLITTAPSVVYKIFPTGAARPSSSTAPRSCRRQSIEHLEEADAHLQHSRAQRAPRRDLEAVPGTPRLTEGHRVSGLTGTRVKVTYEMPLAEVVFDFFDKMKSVSRGYASLDYELAGYSQADLVKLDILVNGEAVDALSIIVHKERSYQRGRDVCAKLKEVIPSRCTRSRFRRPSARRSLPARPSRRCARTCSRSATAATSAASASSWRKQKEGKKRMKQVGSVEIPQEAFLAVLKTRTDVAVKGGTLAESVKARLSVGEWKAVSRTRWYDRLTSLWRPSPSSASSSPSTSASSSSRCACTHRCSRFCRASA